MGGISFVRLDMKTCMQAHRYILFNCDELIQIRTYNDEEEIQDYIFFITATCATIARSNGITRSNAVTATCASFRTGYDAIVDYDQSLNDNEIIGDTEVRKVRGGTRMTDVWNLKEDELIPVQFNGNGQPLGNEGGIFNKFTGCVARVANQIPLDAADWRKVPLSIKEDCWSLMTKRFTIPEPPLGDIVKSWFLKDLGEKWRNYKCSLKQNFLMRPLRLRRHRSHAGKQNRSLQTTVHTAGSKSFARYAHELEKEKQVPINRADLYKTVHMRSDGSPINPDVAEKIRRMEEIGLNDSGSSQTSNEFRVDGSIGWSPSDRYAQVIGPERHGRIRGVGLGPTPSSHPANTNVRSRATSIPRCSNNNQFHQQFIDHLMQVGKRVLTMPMTQKVQEQMVLKVED
ncbi:hypothetical protein CJ030_MR2G005740 [Morella rubra]|uniref:Uncharacterized protein n=1 Tax=Morella rubra TaxID=262757 RepID=A0A6A1WK48_9ROSI|nr:hypothetical protein CJ030_MR2G005740 [Morella rubra]